jgi:hypothetical protein
MTVIDFPARDPTPRQITQERVDQLKSEIRQLAASIVGQMSKPCGLEDIDWASDRIGEIDALTCTLWLEQHLLEVAR